MYNEIEFDNDVIDALEEDDVGFGNIYTTGKETQVNEIDQNDNMRDMDGNETQSSSVLLKVSNMASIEKEHFHFI